MLAIASNGLEHRSIFPNPERFQTAESQPYTDPGRRSLPLTKPIGYASMSSTFLLFGASACSMLVLLFYQRYTFCLYRLWLLNSLNILTIAHQIE